MRALSMTITELGAGNGCIRSRSSSIKSWKRRVVNEPLTIFAWIMPSRESAKYPCDRFGPNLLICIWHTRHASSIKRRLGGKVMSLTVFRYFRYHVARPIGSSSPQNSISTLVGEALGCWDFFIELIGVLVVDSSLCNVNKHLSTIIW
jgi:hypothetical protein